MCRSAPASPPNVCSRTACRRAALRAQTHLGCAVCGRQRRPSQRSASSALAIVALTAAPPMPLHRPRQGRGSLCLFAAGRVHACRRHERHRPRQRCMGAHDVGRERFTASVCAQGFCTVAVVAAQISALPADGAVYRARQSLCKAGGSSLKDDLPDIGMYARHYQGPHPCSVPHAMAPQSRGGLQGQGCRFHAARCVRARAKPSVLRL